MAKPRFGRCVHCLSSNVIVTDDHVLPESWYPPNTPGNVPRWVAPACKPCNHALGKIERNLLLMLGLCVDPDSPTTADFARRALRAVDHRLGRNPADQRARAGSLAKVGRATVKAPDPDSVIPPFVEKWGRKPEDQDAVKIPADAMKRFTEKVVRGIAFVDEGRYIEPPFEVQSAVMREPLPRERLRHLVSKTLAIPTAITVRRFSAPVGFPAISFYEIDIWSTLSLFAVVCDPRDYVDLDM